MKKFAMIAATMALTLGVASAQDAAPVTSATVTNFTDIPAGHWAKDAVDLITQRGLIQGFPDGTFRGNENLTRYQAALIFARLLQTGALTQATPALSADDLATITKGMQDVSTELAAIGSRVGDLEAASTAQQGRITALEGQIAAMGTATTDTASMDEMTARIDALEEAMQNMPEPAAGADGAAGPAGPQGPAGAQGPAGPAGPTANVDALTARVSALEARATTSTTTNSTVTTSPATPPTTVVIGDTMSGDSMTMMADDESNSGLYAGISTSAVFSGAKGSAFGQSVPFISSFGATIGASKVLFGLGVRANVDYVAPTQAIQADVNAMYALGVGRLSPYVGAGFGLSSSNAYANVADKATDYYVNGIIGADIKVVGNLSAFAEFNGKYYLSNKGTGTNNTDVNATKSFSPAAKIGLKYYF